MDIDRIAPTRRPEGKPAQHQRWLDLLFLHWAVPVEVLRALVPASLEIDTCDGVATGGGLGAASRWVVASCPPSSFWIRARNPCSVRKARRTS